MESFVRYLIVASFTLLGVVSTLGMQTNGTCDLINHDRNIAFCQQCIRNMTGVWYQEIRTANPVEQGYCSTTTFLSMGSVGVVYNTEVVPGMPGQHARLGIVEPDYYKIPGRFFVNFDNIRRDFYILSTDYNNYAIVYSCMNNPDNTKNVYAWLLSRERNYKPSQEVFQTIEAIGAKNPEIQDLDWKETKQNGC